MPQNLLTRFYNSILDDNDNIKLWNEYGSIATHNEEFDIFFHSIINEICSTQYNYFEMDIMLECMNLISSFAVGIHSNSYNIQNGEFVFDEKLSHIKFLSQRNILNLTERSSFSCQYDDVFWPKSMNSLINYKDKNETTMQMYYNIDCFFMELSLRYYALTIIHCCYNLLFCKILYITYYPEWMSAVI